MVPQDASEGLSNRTRDGSLDEMIAPRGISGPAEDNEHLRRN